MVDEKLICGCGETFNIDVPELKQSDNFDKYKAEAIAIFKVATRYDQRLRLTKMIKAIFELNHDQITDGMMMRRDMFMKLMEIAEINLPEAKE